MVVFDLKTALGSKSFELLHGLGITAANSEIELWLVGGSVRDIILGNPINDFDLTSEMPADELGELLLESHNGRKKSQSQFKTQKLIIKDSVIDLATARTEIYENPGSLPKISLGNIEDDLMRRDFSINALAISLHPDNFGRLLDRINGYKDINQRLIRVLHPNSFQDDPSRLFRAVRYQIRLGFKIEKQTLALIKRDAQFIASISSARLRREIELILREENSIEMILEAANLTILSNVNLLLTTSNIKDPLVQSINRGLSSDVLLGVLCSVLSQEEILNFKKRLGVTKKQARILDDVASLKKIESVFGEPLDAERLDSVLLTSHEDAILAIASSTSNRMVAKNLDRYLAGYASKLPLTGTELVALGIKAGPEIGIMQRELRYAMIDRIILDKRDAVLFVLKKLEGKPN